MKTETHDKNATNADQLAVQNHQMGWYIETEKPNLNTRQRNESIMQFVESEKIWPPGCYARGLFIPPLREVLMRLPEQVFEFFEEHISFVLDCPKVKAWAMNVPNLMYNGIGYTDDRSEAASTPSTPASIVFMRSAWELPHAAMVGLIAHELAHSFVNGSDYSEDEALANEMARSWGFAEKLLALENEKNQRVKATHI